MNSGRCFLTVCCRIWLNLFLHLNMNSSRCFFNCCRIWLNLFLYLNMNSSRCCLESLLIVHFVFFQDIFGLIHLQYSYGEWCPGLNWTKPSAIVWYSMNVQLKLLWMYNSNFFEYSIVWYFVNVQLKLLLYDISWMSNSNFFECYSATVIVLLYDILWMSNSNFFETSCKVHIALYKSKYNSNIVEQWM
jgi:hypothetical protein